MKKVFLFILMMFTFIGVYAKTYTYSSALSKSNSYINKFDHYNEYIISNSNGFLTENEFENAKSENGNLNYLVTGLEFWIKNSSNSCTQCKYILNGIKAKNSINEKSGVRVTELVRNTAKVTGKGTQTNPWVFVNQYRVLVGVNNQDMGSALSNGNNYVIVEENGETQFNITSNAGYKYKSDNCKESTYSNNILTIKNVTENISCVVNFEERRYNVTIDNNGGTGTDTDKIYLIYKDSWYSDDGYKNKILKINIPVKEGYTFNDYYIENPNKVVANEKGEFTTTDVAASTDDLTMKAEYTPNIYTITLNNQSATSAGTPKIYEKYNVGYYLDSAATANVIMTSATNAITTPTKTGYDFEGYYTSDGSQYIDKNGKITSTANNNTTNFTNNNGSLYAHWTAKTYTITLKQDDATTIGSTTTTATYDSTTLSSITRPQRKYTVSFDMNGTGATATTTALTATYTLKGWYTNASGGSKVASKAATPVLQASISGYTDSNNKWTRTEDATTLYAQWSRSSVTLPAITKSNSACKWAEGSKDGTQYDGGASYTPTSDKKFYAVCTANSIEFAWNGGNYVLSSTSTSISRNGVIGKFNNGDYYLAFTTTGTHTLKFTSFGDATSSTIDIFVIGSGHNGGGSSWSCTYYNGKESCYAVKGGSGGNGGNHKNSNNVTITTGTEYSIKVGDSSSNNSKFDSLLDSTGGSNTSGGRESFAHDTPSYSYYASGGTNGVYAFSDSINVLDGITNVYLGSSGGGGEATWGCYTWCDGQDGGSGAGSGGKVAITSGICPNSYPNATNATTYGSGGGGKGTQSSSAGTGMQGIVIIRKHTN